MKNSNNNGDPASCCCGNATALPVYNNNNNLTYPPTPSENLGNNSLTPNISATGQEGSPTSLPSETTNRASYQPPHPQNSTDTPPQEAVHQSPSAHQSATMHATAGRQNPSHPENPEVGARVPVPNELRPVPPAVRPACYLPQPEDSIMAQEVLYLYIYDYLKYFFEDIH